jgi:hypothetical protein
VVRGVRVAYLVLTALFLVGLLAQVFLAGLALFASGQGWQLHIDVGYILHLAPLLLLLAAAVGRVGSRLIWLTVGLVVSVGVQPFLPLARDISPLLAALHPVNALLIFWLAVAIARGALALVRAQADELPPAVEAPPAQA